MNLFKDLHVISANGSQNAYSMTDLQHLPPSTQSIDTASLEACVVQLDELLPLQVLEVVGLLVQTETAKPVGDVLEKSGVGGVLRGLGAATTTTGRATAVDLITQKASVVVVEATAKTELA